MKAGASDKADWKGNVPDTNKDGFQGYLNN